MKILFTLAFLLGVGSAQGYAIGYARLYNPEIKKSVDILYDQHMSGALSDYEFQTLPVEALRKNLYSTEKHFLEGVERINSSAHASVTALVCESRGEDWVGSGVFLGYFNSLFAKRLPNITYVDADIVRNTLGTYAECRKKLPITGDRVAQIIRNAGHASWSSYYEFYQKRLKKECTYPDFIDYCAIADAEMLLHILSLSHSHIIVYCGAWHAKNIAQFLQEKAGYVEVYEYNSCMLYNGFIEPEISKDHLWPLEHLPSDSSPVNH